MLENETRDARTVEYRVVGPPGCGKTTWLGEQVEQAVRSGSQVMVCSLTKTAAAEVASRGLPISWDSLGTLHSHCYHALGKPQIAEDRECVERWNEENPEYRMSLGSNDLGERIDGDNLEPTRETRGDALMEAYQIIRARMEGENMPEPVRAFANRWRTWKEENGLLDFTDLIETCLQEVTDPPGGPDVIFVDEAQDLDLDLLEMSLIRKWGESAGSLYIVGDPDQCQPADTMVETASGPVRIEDLDPEKHRVLTWDRHSQAVLGHGKKYPFRKAVRNYTGRLLSISAGGRKSKCTPEHRWLIRWSNRDTANCCTYLMRRGDRWRIGWCQIFDSDGTLRLSAKATMEKADEAWILSTNPDRRKASVDESVLTARYGLVAATFSDAHPTAEQLYRIWESLDPEEQAERARRCLEDHGREIRHPMWKRGDSAPGVIERVHEMRACNVVPGLMSVPIHDGGKRNHWETITEVDREDFQGDVYSLRVEPCQTYIADGMVTHNCIYTWRGADPSAFTATDIPQENRSVLSQSYRVPVAVHARAVRWISNIEGREPVEYRPRDHQGEVRQIRANWGKPEDAVRDAEQYLEQGMSVMFLTTCSYMLQPLIRALRASGTPFHNPYRRRNGAWNPLQRRRGQTTTADRLLSFLKMNALGHWNAEDVVRWTDMVKVKGALNANGKKMVRTLTDTHDGTVEGGYINWDDLYRVLTEEAISAGLEGNLAWLEGQTTAAKLASTKFPLNIIRNRGTETLSRVPQVTIGTVHCSPGDEPVFTTNGWVRMEDLNPQWHRLPSHNRSTNAMTWGGSNTPGSKGFDFKKSARPYRGKLAVIETGRSRTRITPNHRLPVCFAEEFYDKWCCYIMRKGGWWRVGMCTTAHKPYRSGGVPGRLSTEQADSGWILSVHDTREEAVMAEAIWQARYGIPGTTFRAARNRQLEHHQLEEIHESTKDNVKPRVRKLFEDTHLQEDQPLYTRSTQEGDQEKRKTVGHTFTTAAGNLTPLSGRIQVLVPTTNFLERRTAGREEYRTALLTTATISLEDFEGTVYGLDVPPFHNYISGGAVVHNSVKGAESDVVYVFPDISRAGAREWDSPQHRALVYRLFYVAMTRARDTLVLASPGGYYTVPLHE